MSWIWQWLGKAETQELKLTPEQTSAKNWNIYSQNLAKYRHHSIPIQISHLNIKIDIESAVSCFRWKDKYLVSTLVYPHLRKVQCSWSWCLRFNVNGHGCRDDEDVVNYLSPPPFRGLVIPERFRWTSVSFKFYSPQERLRFKLSGCCPDMLLTFRRTKISPRHQ